MGALDCKVDRRENIVVVSGVGLFNLRFITSFGRAVRARGLGRFCKLFDLRRADIELSYDDLQTMVASMRVCSAATAGPIAIVLGKEPSPMLLDMAVVVRNRIGNRRRMRLFTEEAEARQWLLSEASIVNLAADLARLPVNRLTLVRNL